MAEGQKIKALEEQSVKQNLQSEVAEQAPQVSAEEKQAVQLGEKLGSQIKDPEHFIKTMATNKGKTHVEKLLAARQAGKADPKTPGISDKFTQALITILPAVAGGLFGGGEGLGAGLNAGLMAGAQFNVTQGQQEMQREAALREKEKQENKLALEQDKMDVQIKLQDKTLDATARQKYLDRLADIEKAKVAAWAKVQGSVGNIEKDLNKISQSYGKDYAQHSVTKRTREMVSAYERIQATASLGTKAGDLQLLFEWAKMLDPASIVRDSEIEKFKGVGGTREWIYNKWNYLKSARDEGGMSDEERLSALEAIDKDYQGQLQAQKQVDDDFLHRATSHTGRSKTREQDLITDISSRSARRAQEEGLPQKTRQNWKWVINMSKENRAKKKQELLSKKQRIMALQKGD